MMKTTTIEGHAELLENLSILGQMAKPGLGVDGGYVHLSTVRKTLERAMELVGQESFNVPDVVRLDLRVDDERTSHFIRLLKSNNTERFYGFLDAVNNLMSGSPVPVIEFIVSGEQENDLLRLSEQFARNENQRAPITTRIEGGQKTEVFIKWPRGLRMFFTCTEHGTKWYLNRSDGSRVRAVRYHDSMRVAGTLPEGVTVKPFPLGDQPAVRTNKGEDVIVTNGDWIVTFADGHQSVFPDVVFSNVFELIKDKNV